MAKRTYIAFNMEVDEDRKTALALERVQTFLGKSGKEILTEAVEKLTQSDEYKEGIRKLIQEAEAELGE